MYYEKKVLKIDSLQSSKTILGIQIVLNDYTFNIFYCHTIQDKSCKLMKSSQQ